MMPPEIVATPPGAPLPATNLRAPFAVLLDVRDEEWANSIWVSRKANELLRAGCRYFVCFGPRSEVVHDQIDDAVINYANGNDLPTTFHEDETPEDVANFFLTVALSGMAQGLLLVCDEASWRSRL